MEAVRKPADARPSLSLYLACLIIGTVAAVCLYAGTLEDTYITFHYARAFASGQGVGAWNPGQPPIEGFSSALWMLLLGFSERLGLSPFAVSKAVGYLGYVFTSLVFFIAARRRLADEDLPGDHFLALYLSALISALFVPLIYYSMTGMEATFFCFEVTATLLTPFLLRSTTNRALWSSLFAAAIIFTRPEGMAVALAVNAYWLFVFRRKRRWPAAALVTALATLGAMTAYRLHRFGEFLPNTYFAKATGGSLGHRLSLGARYDGHFFVVIAPLTVVFFLGTGLLIKRGLARTTVRCSLSFFVLGLFAFFALFILKVGGDAAHAFPIYRQFDQIAPVWILFAALTLESLVRTPRWAIGCTLAVVLLTDAEVVVHHWFILVQQPSKLVAQYGLFHLEPPNPYFLWLRQFSTPDTLTAVSLAGQWPFYVPGRYIDTLGLNDRWIAKHGRVQSNSTIVDTKSDMTYVLSQRPEIIDGTSSGLLLLAGECPIDEVARQQMIDELKADPRFQQNYVFIRNAPYNDLDRALYFRKDYAARFPGQLDAVPVTETSLYRTGCEFP